MSGSWKVDESWDGGSISVDAVQPRAAVQPVVTLYCEERGMGTSVLRLTLGEVDQLIDALIEARKDVTS